MGAGKLKFEEAFFKSTTKERRDGARHYLYVCCGHMYAFVPWDAIHKSH